MRASSSAGFVTCRQPVAESPARSRSRWASGVDVRSPLSMDDLLYALGLPLWLTSSPSAPEASVLSQLAQSDRHVDGSSWHHGAMASASVVIRAPIDAAIVQ